MITDVMCDNLLAVATAYARARRMTLGAVSYRFYGNALFLKQFKRGQRSVTVRLLDEMFDQFAREWPDNEPWPMLQTLTIERVDGKISVNRRSKR